MTNNHTQRRIHWLRGFYNLLEGNATMQPYQTITRERLAELPAGAKLKLGAYVVEFIRRGAMQFPDGHEETFVEYIDIRGIAGSFEESIFLQSATEHLDAVRCTNCNALRAKADCITRVIAFYRDVRFVHFCADSDCAKSYFARHPEQVPKPRRRIS
ncbi:hypothetical protein [Sodalis sp. dw_96]|uniref:hypothetical protein n=1 Tax=Sodalis sp. dw_96 TaxID=2719794 RepID=UPI002105F83A|nr:hypothetical protein [Sodalis sp. dw_96]